MHKSLYLKTWLPLLGLLVSFLIVMAFVLTNSINQSQDVRSRAAEDEEDEAKNLIKNGGFEQWETDKKPKFWTVIAGPMNTGRYIVKRAPGKNTSKYSVQMTCGNSGGCDIYSYMYGIQSDAFPITKGLHTFRVVYRGVVGELWYEFSKTEQGFRGRTEVVMTRRLGAQKDWTNVTIPLSFDADGDYKLRLFTKHKGDSKSIDRVVLKAFTRTPIPP